MTNFVTQDVLFQQLTSCRVAATVNFPANYSNGAQGLGATLTNSGSLSALVVDGVAVVKNDRILLPAQTSGYQNGIYIVLDPGSIVSSWQLQRSADFQTINQIQVGWFTAIEAGETNKGAFFVVTEPAAGAIGVDTISFTASSLDASLGQAAFKAVTDNTQTTVASVTGTFTPFNFVESADAFGTLQDGGPRGNAAEKDVTNFAYENVVSAGSLSTVVGEMVKYVDTLGSIAGFGASQIGGLFSYAGGSASFSITATGVSASGFAVITVNTQTTGTSYVLTATPGTNIISVVMNSNPGASTIGWVWYSGPFPV
jgi:hypothetical protein